MSTGRNSSYNPRTGKRTRPRAWYDHGKKSGCYVATAVYGSYDCPEVWTLRRYRDEYLANSFLGRVFIRTYYFFSPTFVKIFGKTVWFNKMFRNILDKKIEKLHSCGYSSDRYED